MLRFCDSFDHWDDYASKWDNVGFDGFGQPGLVGGRFGSGWQMGPDNRAFRKTLDAQDTWIMGAAIYLTGANPAGVIHQVIDAGSSQMMLRINNSKQLEVYRGNAATLLDTGTTVIPVGVWTYVEFKVVIHNSAGEYEARVNGALDSSGSSVDTQETANAYANQYGIGRTGGANSNQIIWDDIYVCDGQSPVGAGTDDFLGDVRVEALYPNGNGNSSQLIGQDLDSTNNYLNVDEHPPDEDSTFNESASPGDKDTYAYTNLTPTSGTVYGVQIMPYMAKSDAGSRMMASIARHSGTEVDSADRTLSTSYQYFPDIREIKPGGGVWTISDVNGAEFGAKVTV